MKIYVISGKARCGKDTAAQILKMHFEGRGYSVLVTHYADLLKYICKTYFAWDGEKDESGRTLLQNIGTDVVRKKNPNFWVDFIISILKLFPNKWDVVIIPDCRFPNEIDRLREAGFDVTHICVTRPLFDNNLTQEQQAHPSETALDDTVPDITVHNDRDKEALYSSIAQYVLPQEYTREVCKNAATYGAC